MQDISKDLDSNLLLAELEEEDIFPGEADLDPEKDAKAFEFEEAEIEGQLRKYGSKREKEDLLAAYMKEINRFGLLSGKREKELTALFFETRDRDTGQQIICANLRLVVKIAFGFHKLWMKNLMDLIQEGNKGLTHSINKFDPYRGIKFSYYASFWIKAYILKYLMDNWRLVKVGTTQAQRKLFYSLKREKMKLETLGFEPDAEMLAKTLNVREEDVVAMDQRLNGWDLSLNAPLKEGSDEYHENFLPSSEPSVEEDIEAAETMANFREKLGEFRKGLNEKELDVLNLRQLAENPLTLQEIGAMYQISRERVRQIENRLIKNLRKFIKNPPKKKVIPKAISNFQLICEENLEDLELEIITMRYYQFGKSFSFMGWEVIGKRQSVKKLNNNQPLTSLQVQKIIDRARKKLILQAEEALLNILPDLPRRYHSLITGIGQKGRSITPDISEEN